MKRLTELPCAGSRAGDGRRVCSPRHERAGVGGRRGVGKHLADRLHRAHDPTAGTVKHVPCTHPCLHGHSPVPARLPLLCPREKDWPLKPKPENPKPLMCMKCSAKAERGHEGSGAG